jgi:outer membrane protein assembly factor BamB
MHRAALPLLASLAACVSVACATAPNTLELGAAGSVRELADAAALRAIVGARAGGCTPAPGAEPAFTVMATSDELIAARLDRPSKDARIWRAALDEGPAQPALTPGLVGETRCYLTEPRRVSPDVEEGPSAECPIGSGSTCPSPAQRGRGEPGTNLGHEVLVVVGSQRSLRAFDAKDGRQRWRQSAQDRVLLAATSDAERLALLEVDRRGRRSIGVYARNASGAPRERLRITASSELGMPALLNGTLLVPWGAGQLSALDVDAEVELGRVRLGNEPLHALWWGGALFFGGPPWVELTPGGAPPYTLPRRPLPAPAMGPLPDAAGSADVTRLYVQPASIPRAGDASEARGHYMATYGRIAFGLEREQGALAWVLALPGRALAAVAIDDGFIVCDDSGGVRVLSSATGRVQRFWQIARQRRITLGEPLLSACALAPGVVLPADPQQAEPAPESLLEQLAKVLALSDPRLSDAQRFLSRELSARPEPDATRVLIELVRRHSLDQVLQSEAEDLLATRRNGEDHMLAALSESGPRGEEALPPIAPLGEALAALDEKRAAPLLARQLNRPAHTASAISRAAAALEQLASEDQYDELSVFFSLHRTNADSAEWVAAVVSIGRTLLRVGGERARELIQFALRDPLTIPEIKAAMERELSTSPQADLAN